MEGLGREDVDPLVLRSMVSDTVPEWGLPDEGRMRIVRYLEGR